MPSGCCEPRQVYVEAGCSGGWRRRNRCHRECHDYRWCSWSTWCCCSAGVFLTLLVAWKFWLFLLFAVPVPEAAGPINIPAYMGKWYQIANVPQWYDRFQCNKCVTAQYSLNANYSITVVNKALGPGCQISGLAIIPNSNFPARLSITFWMPYAQPAEYWIVDVGEVVNGQYQYAVVSNSLKSTLYILSRHRAMPPLAYNAIVSSLQARGYPTHALVKTPQGCNDGTPVVVMTSEQAEAISYGGAHAAVGYQTSAGVVFGVGAAHGGMSVNSGGTASATIGVA